MISCATLDARLRAAAEIEGAASADDALPSLPDECYRDVAHATLTVGMEARTAIVRERSQTTAANASKRRCVVFYEEVKTRRAAQ